MNNYRLKQNATPFFKENLATQIKTYDVWVDTYHVDPKALEKVEDAYIDYGQKTSISSSNLCGWSNDESLSNNPKGSHFHFTLYFPSVKFREHDQFNKGRITRKLMDEFQSVANRFFLKFAEENKKE